MVTVRSLLDVDIIKENTALLAGHGGLDKAVSYVTIMEAPDFFEWVTGGEFVLTTWYAFSRNPELQVPAFRSLCRTISAIAVKTERFIASVPQEIIDIANEFDVPLFEIKRSTKFRELIQGISGELHDYQTNLLLEVDRHYQDLVKVTLANSDASSMLSGIGRRGKFPCFCITHDEKIIGHYTPPGTRRPDFDSLSKLANNCIARSAEPNSYLRDQEFHIFPCTARRLLLGALVIIEPAELSEKLMLMCQQVAVFLTMKLLEGYDAQQKMLTALLDDILYHKRYSQSELEEKLAQFGLPAHQQYRAIVLQTLQKNQVFDQHTAMAAAATQVLNYLGGVIISRPAEVVILTGGQCKPAAALNSLSDYLISQGMVAGIGPAVAGAHAIEASYQIAGQTAKVLRLTKAAGIASYTDQLVNTLLARSKDSPEGRYLLQHSIQLLREHDDKYRSMLVPTLEAAILAKDLDAASDALHIHVNTLRYRLQKIAAVTGYDFFTPFGRYALTTACLLNRLLPE